MVEQVKGAFLFTVLYENFLREELEIFFYCGELQLFNRINSL